MKRRILISVSLITAILFCVQAQKQINPIVKTPVFSGKTKAIRDMPVIIPGPLHVKPETPENPSGFYKPEPAIIPEGKIQRQGVQDFHGSLKMSNPVLNVEGINNVQGFNAADPNGDIGKDHYVQTINAQFGVFDRQGNIIYGPVDYKSIFESFPGPWNEINWCDPVIVYDHIADRWAFTTMSFKTSSGQFYEMVAVSVSADPLGEYYCYAYQFEDINDYPKMSVWPNGYFITYNIFNNGLQYLHSIVTAVDRNAMLSGNPDAAMIQFQIETPSILTSRMSPLTSDFNGSILPEEEACWVVVAEFSRTGFPWPAKLNVFGFETDWLVPGNSVFDSIAQFDIDPTFPLVVNNAPQPGNFHDVETMQFRLMYPLHYRNLGTHEVMVCCHTVFDGELHGLRWYELRKDDDNWSLYQSGNYYPDSASRYDPSIAVNGNGDIAMGYTKSSLEINPSIWLTGRKAGDPPGEMTFGELELQKGLNYANNYSSSSGRNRWGDYASMMVDPMDDSTFWFTSMYTLEHTNVGNWSTRIFAFTLDESFDEPGAWAGNDTIICQDESLVLNGHAENFTSVQWETTGDGTILFPGELTARYLRGNEDLENGSVMLCLNATGYQPGSCCSDTMTLFINKFPEPEAGANDTICVDYSITLEGEATFADHYYWSSSGSGLFNDSSLLQAVYTPALADTSMEYVCLTLHAEPLFPCAEGASDSIMLVVESCVGIDEMNSGQFSMSVFPNPSTGIINLSASFAEEASPVISIFDGSGNQLFTGIFKTSYSTIQKQFDLSQYPKGIYYLQITIGKKSKTAKVVLSK